jgi:NAD(P)-dependent dehydrogenase (short-subunit alcohol dehydrogenase family)
MNPRRRFDGRTAVVVGAGQAPGSTTGNGRAVALLLAEEGARVLAVDRNADSAAETAQLICAAGGSSEAFALDVGNPDGCAELVRYSIERLDQIDVVHYNVGILDPADGRSADASVDAWDRTLQINLRGAWLISREAAPHMTTGGSITFVSSIGARLYGVAPLAYMVSKTGLETVTRNLAFEYAPAGIRVNAVVPGLINTPMAFRDMTARRGVTEADVDQERSKLVPLGRVGTAQDVAYAVAFLASDEASFVTGAVLPVDGGQLLRRG